ncbi:MAG: tRNA (adenosine(37)-N6)-threonylcarbamoyltransferase complex transferase subunit TsaD [Planctomycetes bacterium]|nr:tRNA (adenosine(37)-N6)-threonylcarbamoyltransferase complex transferase subunit TsaD [Planctomycetota bacterium]
MLVLAIESTCDETAAAVLEAPRRIVSQVVHSQVPSHKRFGGVVPEVASRLHLQLLAPAVLQTLEQAGISMADIGLIAVAHRPGLIGGLLVGVTMAKGLSLMTGKPLVMVDHLHGHIMACDLVEPIHYPCIAGIFSGAHCNIYYGSSGLEWELLARTRDDAPGEAFDKVAKLLELPYPGGPSIQAFSADCSGNPLSLPSPLPASLSGDFSFSGIKTAVLYSLRGTNGRSACPRDEWPLLAASFQNVVAGALAKRMCELLMARGCRHLYVGGGVACNKRLRTLTASLTAEIGAQSHFAPLSLCVDNAAMIARAGIILHEAGIVSPLDGDVGTYSELGLPTAENTIG